MLSFIPRFFIRFQISKIRSAPNGKIIFRLLHAQTKLTNYNFKKLDKVRTCISNV